MVTQDRHTEALGEVEALARKINVHGGLMQRRDVLKMLASGAVLPVFSTPLAAFFREAQAQTGPGYKLRTLNPHQNATVVVLTDLIIPETDTPGAKAALVNEFIDVILTEWANDAERQNFLQGLAGIDKQSQELFGKDFVDASPHRAALPSAYNSYLDVRADPSYDADHEDEQMLLRPLFFTSYLLDDFLADGEFPADAAVVISSASSKTASALAFLLARRGSREVIGLTSQRSADFTRDLGAYDHVAVYEEISSLPSSSAIYVDICGDAGVREAVHGHYGEGLAHSAVVGATHHDKMGDVPDSLPGPRPAFFFAPDRLSKRSQDWGREGLEQRIADAWRPYVEWAPGWMEVVHGHGPDALQQAYLDLLDGRIDPAQAHVLSLAPQ